jgi:calcium binding protein 39
MPQLDFEARKSAVILLSTLIGMRIGSRYPVVEYIGSGHEEDVLLSLIAGYEVDEAALNYGIILRECIRHESLAQTLLASRQVLDLFTYATLPNFDVASDAFATLRDLLTRHPLLTATYLIERFDDFFPLLNGLLVSENYVTKRQSLKLVSEILMERTSCDVMRRYVSSTTHLKTIMRLLRDPSNCIQLEAFHIFKIFVANPNKDQHVFEILLKNQAKLLDFLDTLQAPPKGNCLACSRTLLTHFLLVEEERFNAEKALIREHIIDLDPEAVQSSVSPEASLAL